MSADRQRLDILAPPVLLLGVYLVLFGYAAIEASFDPRQLGYRVGHQYLFFRGMNADALLYLWLGLGLFAVGYYSPLGAAMGCRVELARWSFVPGRASLVTIGLFGWGLGAMLYIAERFMYSRLPQFLEGGVPLDPELGFLSTMGDLVLMAYALSLWRFALSRRRDGPQMSGFGIAFLWVIVTPTILLVLWLQAGRAKVGYVVLTTLLAYHYGWRRVRPTWLVSATVITFFVVMPLTAFVRTPPEARPSVDSVWAWLEWTRESVMQRTTSLEGFTVTYENRENVPQIEPAWMVLATGLVPRLAWPDKPLSTFVERFSDWASGDPHAVLMPSLPGELLLHFDYVGGLLAMLALGVAWSMAYHTLMGDANQPHHAGFICILLFPLSLETVESGFVAGYGGLLRFLLVGLVAFRVSCRRIDTPGPTRSTSRERLAAEGPPNVRQVVAVQRYRVGLRRL